MMIRDVLFGDPIVVMGMTLTVWAALALLLVVGIGQASRDDAFDVERYDLVETRSLPPGH